jgi:hypothetical protein
MLKIEKNFKQSVIFGPLAIFLLMKLILWPAQQSECDMPALDTCKAKKNVSFHFLFLIVNSFFVFLRIHQVRH